MSTVTPPYPVPTQPVPTATVTPPPTPLSVQLPQLLVELLPWVVGGLVALAVVLVLVVRVLSERRASPWGGSTDLSVVLRSKPDAVGVMIDGSTRRIFYVPLTNQGGYYTYKYAGRTEVFIPTTGSVFLCGESRKPCFLMYRVHDAVEYDPVLAAVLAIGSLQSEEVAEVARQPLFTGLERLQALVLKGLSSELAKRSGVVSPGTGMSIDVGPLQIMEQLLSYLSRSYSGLIAGMKSLAEVTFTTGGALEKRAAGTAELLKYVPYIGLLLILVAIALVIPRLLG